MRLSCPSPVPTEVGTAVFACGGVSPLVPLVPPEVLPPPPDEPQAATSIAADAAASSVPARVHLFMS